MMPSCLLGTQIYSSSLPIQVLDVHDIISRYILEQRDRKRLCYCISKGFVHNFSLPVKVKHCINFYKLPTTSSLALFYLNSRFTQYVLYTNKW